MTYEPSILLPFLSIWNFIVAPLALYMVFHDNFQAWPRIARLGFAVACVGLISDSMFSIDGVPASRIPYWALKDLGLGLVSLSFAHKFYVERGPSK